MRYASDDANAQTPVDSIDENPELTEALEAELKKALTAFFDSVE